MQVVFCAASCATIAASCASQAIRSSSSAVSAAHEHAATALRSAGQVKPVAPKLARSMRRSAVPMVPSRVGSRRQNSLTCWACVHVADKNAEVRAAPAGCDVVVTVVSERKAGGERKSWGEEAGCWGSGRRARGGGRRRA